jgi:hypothetical protein
MRLLKEPILSTETPSLFQMQLISSHYPTPFLVSLFDREPWRTYLLTLGREFTNLAESDAVCQLVPHLNALEPEAASEVIHSLIVQGQAQQLTPEILRTPVARHCFLAHGTDLRSLSREQILAILPAMELQPNYGLDQRTAQLLQTTIDPTVVPSVRFKDGRLFVFNCSHILNGTEMLDAVTEVQRLCESHQLPVTAKLVFEVYRSPAIPAQCPRCLLHHLSTFLQRG